MNAELLDVAIELVVRLIAELSRSGELTQEQAQERRQKMLDAFQQDHWKSRG